MGKSINAVPPAFKDKVLIAYPTLPEDRKEQTLRDFGALVQKHNLPATNLGVQLSAYAAARILLEG